MALNRREVSWPLENSQNSTAVQLQVQLMGELLYDRAPSPIFVITAHFNQVCPLLLFLIFTIMLNISRSYFTCTDKEVWGSLMCFLSYVCDTVTSQCSCFPFYFSIITKQRLLLEELFCPCHPFFH